MLLVRCCACALKLKTYWNLQSESFEQTIIRSLRENNFNNKTAKD